MTLISVENVSFEIVFNMVLLLRVIARIRAKEKK